MIIDEAVYTAMIEHMRQAAPREGVGLLAGLREGHPRCPLDTDGDGNCGRRLCPVCGESPDRVVDRWVPLVNASEFPGLRYEVDDGELIAAWESLDADGRRPWVLVHSHTSTSAAPSPLDIRYAVDSTLLHMIVSLAGARPVAVLWRLNPDAPPVEQARKIRYQVVDLGIHTVGTTDLTRRVTDA